MMNFKGGRISKRSHETALQSGVVPPHSKATTLQSGVVPPHSKAAAVQSGIVPPHSKAAAVSGFGPRSGRQAFANGASVCYRNGPSEPK